MDTLNPARRQNPSFVISLPNKENNEMLLVPEQSIIFHLAYLSKTVNYKANTLFQDSGFKVRVDQVPILMACYYQAGLSQQEIADMLFRDKSSVQRTIVSLKRNKILVAEGDHQDRRKNIITLTEYGRQLAAVLEQRMMEVEQIVFGHISEGDQQRLLHVVKELESHIATDNSLGKTLATLPSQPNDC